MLLLRLNKFLPNNLCMSFTKVKPTLVQPTAKPMMKPPPTPFKSAPFVQPNLKPGFKAPNLAVPVKAAVAETETMQVDEPIIKQKQAVVTIMGHVDHGKTTLIDFLRKSDIAQKEDGGITQRIGAFRINCLGKKITFIDTPGHEAFVNMRQRGASVTDLVVLVVSATEGVKKQTLEVIELIKKLQIPVIVAINKIDLPQATPEETEAELQKAGLSLEINGGSIPSIHISAKNGINIDMLCELIIDETKNATAIYNGLAYASVLEAFQTKEGLNSMTVIVEKGSIKINSILVIGKESFKVKTILDDMGQHLSQTLPGDAVQIVGIPFIPAPGDIVFEVENEKKAKYCLEQNLGKNYEQSRAVTKNEKKQISSSKIHFERSREGRKEKRAFCRGVREVWMNKFAEEEETILAKIQQLRKQEGNQVIDFAILELEDKLAEHKKYVFEYLRNSGDSPDTLNFIMKFGDRGMEETILMQLQKLKPEIEQETKVKLNLIKTDVGDVTVGDIEEAQNCCAQIFTFGSGVSSEAKNFLEGAEPPRTHKLIHNLLKDLKEASMQKKLKVIKGVERGRCEVADLFTIKMKKKEAMVPGIKITQGKILKKCKVYVMRGGLPVSGALDISFIKTFKKEVLELKKGEEGTIGFIQEGISIEKGDELAFFEEV